MLTRFTTVLYLVFLAGILVSGLGCASGESRIRSQAEHGDAAAQHKLGSMYWFGAEGIQQNPAEAVRWYRLAADGGNTEAQVDLGILYTEGRGVPQNSSEALRLFRAAAEKGNARAQVKIGKMYEDGRGVPRDFVQAHMWWNLAGAHGDKQGWALRDFVATKMTPAQIAEAQKLASEWKGAR
ncbi:MAG: tetratricopeptide repeat protein [Nitrospiraceae bacterium]